MSALPDTQLHLRPGIVDFSWGHPDPALLPAAALADAAAAALAGGADALGYGPEQGPGSLIAQIQRRLEGAEGAAPPADQLMVTGGISAALDMLCAQLSRPGDVALVEAPTYHLALRIFRDRGLRIISVPGDGEGLRVDAAEAALRALGARGERVAFLYVVANFGNPSGATLSPQRRRALADLALREGLAVLEDDAYGELWYDAPPPPSIAGLAPGGPVVRLGSYAKVLAPGLRLGWIHAAPDLVRRCAASGVLDSGGGVNHFAAVTLARLLATGFLDGHLERLRATLRARRDALLAALERHMPAGCAWSPARGGYFVWVRLPQGLDAAALLPAAEAAGVAYLPGARFFAEGGGGNSLRLSFSLLPGDELSEGAARLGAALAAASGQMV
jgi:2-aminoadipate transaminase